MDSAIDFSQKKNKNKLFIKQISIYTFSILGIYVISILYYQFRVEKDYIIQFQNQQLSKYNTLIYNNIKNHKSIDLNILDKIKTDSLRISIFDLNANIIFDNFISDNKDIENHKNRKEIIEAMKQGHGYTIKRLSKTLDIWYFYYATLHKDKSIIIRTALPYKGSNFSQILSFKNKFLIYSIILLICLLLIFYIYTNKIGKNIDNYIQSLYKQLKEGQEEKSRIKQQMTQNIAHELKTPVSSIKAYIETIYDDPSMTEETRQNFLNTCLSQTDRLCNLIQDISMITKLEDKTYNKKFEEVNLYKLINSIENQVSLALKQQKMRIDTLISPKTNILSDSELLYSIFRNLIDNSIAYAGVGSIISIQVLEDKQDKIVIIFSDNGIGVEKEELQRIFERFYRIDKGRSRKLGGTGLGLSIV